MLPDFQRWDECVVCVNRWERFVLQHTTWGTSKCHSPRFSRLSALPSILQLVSVLACRNELANARLGSEWRKNWRGAQLVFVITQSNTAILRPTPFVTLAVLRRGTDLHSAFRVKWNGSRRFKTGPLLKKRTMNVDCRLIGRKKDICLVSSDCAYLIGFHTTDKGVFALLQPLPYLPLPHIINMCHTSVAW